MGMGESRRRNWPSEKGEQDKKKREENMKGYTISSMAKSR